LEHWALPSKSTSLDSSCKMETDVLPYESYLFSLYTWELNFRQTVWDKSNVLLRTSWGITWEPFGNLIRTSWEHDENTLRTPKTKKYIAHSPPKEKIITFSWVHAKPFHWTHEALIFKIVCHHFFLKLMARAQNVRHIN
jgi:hypothetical protein